MKTSLVESYTVRPTLEHALKLGRVTDCVFTNVIETTGGRQQYFKALYVSDCVTRAVTVATGFDYKTVYDRLNFGDGRGGNSARNGVYTCESWFKTLMTDAGFVYKAFDRPPLLGFGIPKKGTHILCVPRHYMACVDGNVYDAGSSSVRKPDQRLEGVWTLKGKPKIRPFRFKKPVVKRVPWKYFFHYICPNGEHDFHSRDMQKVINHAYKTFKPTGENDTPYFRVDRERVANSGYDEYDSTYLNHGHEYTWEDFTPPKAFVDKVKVCCTRFRLFSEKAK